MKFLITLIMFSLFISAHGSDQLLSQKAQEQDLKLFKVWGQRDNALRAHYRHLELLFNEEAKNNQRHECEEDQVNGSSLCWEKCSKDNWPASSCANLCGTSTSAGSKACWKKCDADSWSTQHCSSLCGTSTGAGSEFCWGKCVGDNWSLATCAGQCGVTTAKGSTACWNKCSASNYSTQHCASVCKLN